MAKKESIATPQNLTPEEAAVFQRVATAEDDWKTITEEDVEDYSLMDDPFMLPKPAQEKFDKKEFKYRWIERTSQRLDTIRNLPIPRRWWICNGVNTPYLKNFIDPNLGCVSCLDQMLMFKPYWMYAKELTLKAELNEAQERGSGVESMDGQKRDFGTFEAGKSAVIGKRDHIVADEEVFGAEHALATEAEFGDIIE